MFYIVKNSKDGKFIEIIQEVSKPKKIEKDFLLLTKEDIDGLENIRDYIIKDGKLIENIEAKLNTLKNEKIKEINHICKETIENGFNSDALGIIHRYQSQEVDQLNLIGAISSGIEQNIKCSFNDGENWEYKIHTPLQLKKLLEDALKIKIEILIKTQTLKQQIKVVNSIENLKSISWEEGEEL